MPTKKKKTQVPIQWNVSQEIASKYATNLVVQNSQQEFFLSFFETLPPILLGSSDEVQDQLQSLGTVRSDCVARVIVSPSRFKEFVDLLNQAWSRFEKRENK